MNVCVGKKFDVLFIPRIFVNKDVGISYCGAHRVHHVSLYSKGHTKPDMKELKPYYDELFAEFFPAKIAW
jgi:hypothetical protein